MPSNISTEHQDLLHLVDQLADEVLFPAAAEVDGGTELSATNFAGLAELGLYGLVAARSVGGLGCPPAVVRAVLRRLASGCGATAFAFAQHHGTLGAVCSTDNQELQQRWQPALVKNDLAGIGYAHVRRGGPPVLSAAPVGDGWVFNGSAPWVTSWGFASAFGIAAKSPDGDLVWALIPGHEVEGLQAGSRFDLMVFGATQTVPLHFENYRVGVEDVLSVADGEAWTARDRFLAARPSPLAAGIGDRALVLLAEKEPGMAQELEPWWNAVADDAEAQSVQVDEGTADIELVAAARAELLSAVQRLTTAVVAACGGSAMEQRHPAQRLAREALFYVVQAQSADGRAASLRLLGKPENEER